MIKVNLRKERVIKPDNTIRLYDVALYRAGVVDSWDARRHLETLEEFTGVEEIPRAGMFRYQRIVLDDWLFNDRWYNGTPLIGSLLLRESRMHELFSAIKTKEEYHKAERMINDMFTQLDSWETLYNVLIESLRANSAADAQSF